MINFNLGIRFTVVSRIVSRYSFDLCTLSYLCLQVAYKFNSIMVLLLKSISLIRIYMFNI